MEWFNRDVGSTQRPLQCAPKVLDSVCMNASPNVSIRMIDNLMSKVDSAIRMVFIGDNQRSGSYGFVRQIMQNLACASFDNLSPNAAFAFQHPNNDGLALESAIGLKSFRPLRLMHVLGFAAYERLVHLNFARELRAIIFVHDHPQPMEHEPSGLLGDAKGAVKLVGANTVFAVTKHPQSAKPLIEPDGGILENGSDLDGELLLAALAEPNLASADERMLLRAATGARYHAIRPAKLLRVFKAAFGIAEVDDGFLKCMGRVHVSKATPKSIV